MNVNKGAESMDAMWLIKNALFDIKTSYQVSFLHPVRKQVLAELGVTHTGLVVYLHLEISSVMLC